MINLTKQSLASLKPRTKPHVDYDGELIGFGVAIFRLTPRRGCASTGSTAEGVALPTKRVTLGKTPQLTPEQARKAAGEMLPQCDSAGIPRGFRNWTRRTVGRLGSHGMWRVS
jgi:hypothetical protein